MKTVIIPQEPESDSIYESLVYHNAILEMKNPGGYVGRYSQSELVYGKFLDHIKQNRREHAITIVASGLQIVHQLLYTDYGVLNAKFTEIEETRIKQLIHSLVELGLLNLLTDGAPKKVLKKIKELSK